MFFPDPHVRYCFLLVTRLRDMAGHGCARPPSCRSNVLQLAFSAPALDAESLSLNFTHFATKDFRKPKRGTQTSDLGRKNKAIQILIHFATTKMFYSVCDLEKFCGIGGKQKQVHKSLEGSSLFILRLETSTLFILRLEM